MLFEAAYWRVPHLHVFNENSLVRECGGVRPGMPKAQVVSIFTEYDVAFEGGGANNPALIFRSGGTECVIALDQSSDQVVGTRTEKVSPDFTNNEFHD